MSDHKKRLYRITFGAEDNIDYTAEFDKNKKYFPVLEELYYILDDYDIDGWHFFEPYVEFTWIVPRGFEMATSVKKQLLGVLQDNHIKPNKVITPSNNSHIYGDWYCKSDLEREFGCKVYALSAKMAMLFWKYNQAIDEGKGKENQFMRRLHVLANQLCYNYLDEAALLNKRAYLAQAFMDYGDHGKAVKDYEEKFETKY